MKLQLIENSKKIQYVLKTFRVIIVLTLLLCISSAYALQDNTSYVNMVQDAGGVYKSGAHRSALMRYPCGRIGLWSIDQGEIADAISRGLRLYPCIGAIVNKDNSDWRDTISGSPSTMKVTFRDDVPAKDSSVELTVTPHVSCYRYHLPDTAKDKAIVMTTVDVPALMSWNSQKLKWIDNSFKIIDGQTIEMTISGFKNATIYYYVKFNVPSVSQGTISGSQINTGANFVTGDRIGGFLKFNFSDVIAAVAVSHTSMSQAKKYFEDEFADMAFNTAVSRLNDAWIAKLGKVEASGSELRLKQLYTALYTVYVNIIDATDNPNYTSYKPLLTIASSDYWQYVGGYMRCSWDMSRGVYPLLSLIDPEVFTHILNTYQAQCDRDGKIYRNWEPFADNKWGEHNYSPNIALLGLLEGVRNVDYVKFKNSVKTTFASTFDPNFFSLGYIPLVERDSASRALEYCPQVQALAILARILGDVTTYDEYYKYRTNYKNIYDSANKRFRAKHADGTWAPINAKKVFFEGSGESYVFAVPHDPYGILDLYGSSDAVAKIEEFVRQKSDYNDYKLIYEYLPIFADRSDMTQSLVRTAHVPSFQSCTISEWIFKGGNQGCYYTGNAGPLVCGILGLYWIPTSGATWMITTPSVDRYVIHGKSDITVETINNSPSNYYIKSIKLNGADYPSWLISGKTLVCDNQKLTLSLTDKTSKISNLYLSSTDSEVLSAKTDNKTYIEFEIDPLAASCTAKVYSILKPDSITLDGDKFSNWSYDSASKLVTLNQVTKGVYKVIAPSAQPTNPAPSELIYGKLVDPLATPEARELMSRLVTDYGKRSWSALKLTQDVPYIYSNTGKKPAIISGDFMSYSPSRVQNGADPKNHVEDMITLHYEGYVNAMDWHWGAPTDAPGIKSQRPGDFYTKGTSFDIAATLADAISPEYACLIRDLDAIAIQLKKFSDAYIPVLWRPLHEADGKWFWWGAKGPEPCKKLWRLIFTRFTQKHHLHNLIWVYTPANPTRNEWYPGDDVVDIVGLDAYPKTPDDLLISKWQDLMERYKDKKPVALTEFGGVPDIEAMHKAGIWWCYFSSWNRTLNKSPLEMLIRTYSSPNVVTHEDLKLSPILPSSSGP